MSEHSEFPWNLRQIGGIQSNEWAIEGVGTLICSFEHARLIAAAPSLVEALDNCLETLTYVRQYFDGQGLSAFGDINESIGKARAALNLAEAK